MITNLIELPNEDLGSKLNLCLGDSRSLSYNLNSDDPGAEIQRTLLEGILVNMGIFGSQETVPWDDMPIILFDDRDGNLNLLLFNQKVPQPVLEIIKEGKELNLEGLFSLGFQINSEGVLFFTVSNYIDPTHRVIRENMTQDMHNFVNTLISSLPNLNQKFQEEEPLEREEIKIKNPMRNFKQELKELMRGELRVSNIPYELSVDLILESVEKLGIDLKKIKGSGLRICLFESKKDNGLGMFVVDNTVEDEDIIGFDGLYCGLYITNAGEHYIHISNGVDRKESIALNRDSDIMYFEFINRLIFYFNCLNRRRYCQ